MSRAVLVKIEFIFLFLLEPCRAAVSLMCVDIGKLHWKTLRDYKSMSGKRAYILRILLHWNRRRILYNFPGRIYNIVIYANVFRTDQIIILLDVIILVVRLGYPRK